MSAPAADRQVEVGRECLLKAIAALVEQGLENEKADQALKATEAAYLEHQHWQRWLDEALVEAAVQQELADEAGVMGLAMAESLQDHEVAKSCQPSISELPVSDLVERFKSSPVLSKAREHLVLEKLFAPPLKEAAVELLELERKCHNWYPGEQTREYFSRMADGMMQQLGSCSAAEEQPGSCRAAEEQPGSSGAVPGGAGTNDSSSGERKRKGEEAAAGPGSKRQATEAGPSDATQPEDQEGAGSGPSCDLTRLIHMLKGKTTEILEGVSRFPEDGCDIPAIFRRPSSGQLNYDLSAHGIALVCAAGRTDSCTATCEAINLD